MASALPLQWVATKQPFTISLASLGIGAARQSTLLNNSGQAPLPAGRGWPAALIWLKMVAGAVAPTNGKIYSVFLLRGDDPAVLNIADDAAGALDAAITISNAPLLGTILANPAINGSAYGVFDTAGLGPLGPYWGIAVRNDTDQVINATEGNFAKEYMYYVPESQ